MKPATPPRSEAELLQALDELGRSLAGELDLARLARRATAVLKQRLGLTYVALALVDTARGVAEYLGHAADVEPNAKPGDTQPLGRGLVGRAAREGRAVHVEDVRRDPDYVEIIPGVVSELALPVRSRDRVVAVLSCEALEPDTLRGRAVFLEIAADRLGAAMDNALLLREKTLALEAAKHKARELELVCDIARIASRDLDLRPMLQRMADALSRAFDWEFVACMTVDADRGRFMCEAVTSSVPTGVHVGYGRAEAVDDGGYWKTGDLEELERRHEAATGSLGALVRRIRRHHHRHSEESVDALARKIERALSHADRSEGGNEERERIRGPVPPDNDELREWTVEQWVGHFEKHDEHKNTAMRLMRTRPATEAEIARALKQAEEEDELRHQAMLVALDRIDKRLQREAEEAGDGDDEPAVASAPADVEEDDGEEESDLHPDVIRRKCPPLRATVDLSKKLAGRMRGGRARASTLEYAESILGTAIVGVQMGYYWAHTEGFPKARLARFVLAARQLEAVAALLRGSAPLRLGALADRAERIARDFRAMERRS